MSERQLVQNLAGLDGMMRRFAYQYESISYKMPIAIRFDIIVTFPSVDHELLWKAMMLMVGTPSGAIRYVLSLSAQQTTGCDTSAASRAEFACWRWILSFAAWRPHCWRAHLRWPQSLWGQKQLRD